MDNLWNEGELFLHKIVSDLFLSLTHKQESSGGADDQLPGVSSSPAVPKDDTVS